MLRLCWSGTVLQIPESFKDGYIFVTRMMNLTYSSLQSPVRPRVIKEPGMFNSMGENGSFSFYNNSQNAFQTCMVHNKNCRSQNRNCVSWVVLIRPNFLFSTKMILFQILSPSSGIPTASKHVIHVPPITMPWSMHIISAASSESESILSVPKENNGWTPHESVYNAYSFLS